MTLHTHSIRIIRDNATNTLILLFVTLSNSAQYYNLNYNYLLHTCGELRLLQL